MFFRQVLHPDLGCASYVIADGGIGAVVDPKWEIEEYLELAADNGFEIRHVLETHNHADHVSGRGRLVAATGAAVHVSPTPGLSYEHETLADGEIISPFWAMWGANMNLLLVGVVMTLRMNRVSGATRGGDWSEIRENLRHLIRRLMGRAPRRTA